MQDQNLSQRSVMVCPLDWGLGHASRCVPVIEALLERGCRVVVAADGRPLAFLRECLGERVTYRVLPGKKVRYPDKGSMVWYMLRQGPALLWSAWKEHRQARTLAREEGVSVIVSDNRYGLFQRAIKTVFITHQLFIMVPQAYALPGRLVHCLNRWFVTRFDLCWVPDYPGEDNLSGALSHLRPAPLARFIGLLSRFEGLPETQFVNPLPPDFPTPFILVVLSGPEPQRSLLEKKLYEGFRKLNEAVVFVRGLPGTPCVKPVREEGRIYWMDHAPLPQLAWLLRHTRLFIGRPGYSGLMDLSVFGKKALVIPTPGQTEQEYLAERLSEKNWVASTSQGKLDLGRMLREAAEANGVPRLRRDKRLLEAALNELLGEQ